MALKTIMLNSVGSAISEDGVVYPLGSDRMPDRHMGTELEDCSAEWWDSLSGDDYTMVVGMREYTDEELMELEFISKYENAEL